MLPRWCYLLIPWLWRLALVWLSQVCLRLCSWAWDSKKRSPMSPSSQVKATPTTKYNTHKFKLVNDWFFDWCYFILLLVVVECVFISAYIQKVSKILLHANLDSADLMEGLFNEGWEQKKRNSFLSLSYLPIQYYSPSHPPPPHN